MTSNTKMVMTSRFRKTAGIVGIVAGCLLWALGMSAQEVLSFKFQLEGNPYTGRVEVDLLYQSASKIASKVIDLKDDKSCVLAFSGLTFDGDLLSDRKPKLLVKKAYLDAKGSLEIDPNVGLKKLAPGGAPIRFPVLINGAGAGEIKIVQLALSFSGSDTEVPVTLARVLSISVNIADKSKPEGTTVTALPPPAQDPPPSDIDILWEKERTHGVAGMKKFLAMYKDGGTYKQQVKSVLVSRFRKSKEMVPAAELYLQYFSNDALAAEAKEVIENQKKKKEVVATPEDMLEKAYREIMAVPDGQEVKLKEFIESNPDSKWAQEAKKHVPVKFTPQNQSEDGLSYEVLLDYALQPEVVEISDTDRVHVEILTGSPPILYIKLLEEGNYSVKLLDKEKDPAYANSELELGNVLSLTQIFPVLANSDTLYALSFSKGSPPFRLDFFRDNQYIDHLNLNNSDTVLVFRLADTKKWLGPGQFKVEVVEERRGLTYSGGVFKIPRPSIPWIPIAACVALLVIAVSVKVIRKKMRLREYDKKIKSLQPQPGSPDQAAAGLSTAPQAVQSTEPTVTTSSISPEGLNVNTMPQTGNFVIKSHKKMSALGNKTIPTEADFAQLLNSGSYFQFNLNRLWQDTVLSDLYFSKKSILDIDAFLRTQYVHELSEKEGTIPEIGGFLLGKYHHSQEEVYQVLVEEFVPVTPHSNNVYQLEFSTSSVVQELGMAQEKFPDMALVAWFHTHPGHGLFLSSPDLTIHEGFFKEGYQFAMEIDSLKESLDTGFFTRQKGGSMNNAANLGVQAAWFNWRAVEQATRAMA